MRTMAILSAAMIGGMLCFPLAGAENPGVMKLTVKVSGDAKGGFVTGADANADAAPAAIRSWGYVGVHLSPVPAAVASQLRLKDKGAMIRNIAKGSPADKAGLDRYDVIVTIGKDKPVQTVQHFVQTVHKFKPGEVLALTVLRGGRQEPISLTLGKIPVGQVEYIYEEDPDGQVEDEFCIRRGMPRKKNGKWLELLLPQIIETMPNKAWGNMRVQTQVIRDANNTRQVTVTSVANGKTLSVKSGTDDKMEVTRTTPDGKSKTAVYDNADQLKKKDKEAFDLYHSVRCAKTKPGSSGVGMSILRGIGPMAHVGEDAGAAAAEVQAVAEKLQAELQRHVRELARKTGRETRIARGKISLAVAPVSRQFDVDDSGRIKVHIQKGGNELNIIFAGLDEMKKQNPKLYQEYRKLLDSDKAGQ